MPAELPKTPVAMRILKAFWAIIKAYLMSVGFAVTVIPLIILFTVMYSNRSSNHDQVKASKKAASKTDGSYILELKLSGEVRDAVPSLEEQLMRRFFGGANHVYLPEVRTALRHAAKDKQVKGVFIEIIDLAGTMADYSELHKLFQAYKESEKPLEAWIASPSTYSYFLATVADHINLAPAGEISITGPVFQLAYFGDALRKIGVDFEVVRSGKYKSAFEPMVNNAPSPETLEMYNSMESNLRTHLVEQVAASRKKSVEEVQRWFKQSMFTPKAAVQEGIVDALGFAHEQKSELQDRLKGEDKKARSELVEIGDYNNMSEDLDENLMASGEAGVGIIEATGNIVMTAEERTSEEVITPEDMHEQLEWAIHNNDVKAVVMRVNSPGGSATASDMIWNDVKRLASKKPVVVSMSGVAASGGYYISAPATKIISEPMTITGSIGVIGALPNISPFKEKYGIAFYVVTQSDRAKMLNPGEKSSSFDRDIVLTGIEDVYKTFLERVSEGRKIPVEKVHAMAQGRVYTGAQALELGLVDDLGGLNEAFATAKELGGLDPKKLYPLYHYEADEMSLSECLKGFKNLMQCVNEVDTSILISEFRKQQSFSWLLDIWEEPLKQISALMKQDRYLAYYPFNVSKTR